MAGSYDEIMSREPETPNIPDDAPSRRAWELLGQATPPRAAHGFAAKVAARAASIPQDATPSPVLRWVRLATPLAAAAVLALSMTGNLFLRPATADPTRGLDGLARMEAALELLPEDGGATEFDPGWLEIAAIDDPSQLTDEQLFRLLY